MERPKSASTSPAGLPNKRVAAPTNSTEVIKRELSHHHVQASNREHYKSDFQNEMTLIGAELHRLRTERGRSIDWVAQAIKIPKLRLARIEQGTYIHFGLTDLYSLAGLYGVSALEIVSVIPGTRFDDLDATAALSGP